MSRTIAEIAIDAFVAGVATAGIVMAIWFFVYQA